MDGVADELVEEGRAREKRSTEIMIDRILELEHLCAWHAQRNAVLEKEREKLLGVVREVVASEWYEGSSGQQFQGELQRLAGRCRAVLAEVTP